MIYLEEVADYKWSFYT